MPRTPCTAARARAVHEPDPHPTHLTARPAEKKNPRKRRKALVGMKRAVKTKVEEPATSDAPKKSVSIAEAPPKVLPAASASAVEDFSEDDEETSEEEGPTVEAELKEARKELEGAEAGYQIAYKRMHKMLDQREVAPLEDFNFLTKQFDLWYGIQSELGDKCCELVAKINELKAAQRAAERERRERERERERERRDRYPWEEEERAGPRCQWDMACARLNDQWRRRLPCLSLECPW